MNWPVGCWSSGQYRCALCLSVCVCAAGAWVTRSSCCSFWWNFSFACCKITPLFPFQKFQCAPCYDISPYAICSSCCEDWPFWRGHYSPPAVRFSCDYLHSWWTPYRVDFSPSSSAFLLHWALQSYTPSSTMFFYLHVACPRYPTSLFCLKMTIFSFCQTPTCAKKCFPFVQQPLFSTHSLCEWCPLLTYFCVCFYVWTHCGDRDWLQSACDIAWATLFWSVFHPAPTLWAEKD